MMAQEIVYTTKMLANLSASKLIDFCYKAIKELTVVAHDDGCAVKSLYGFLQNIFRLHIEMVCRLVENKQINRFEQQTNHRKAATFATAEHLYLLFRCLATEHECSENVVYAQSDVAFSHVVDGFKHREILIKELRLILREIANLHVMSYFQHSAIRYLAHYTLHKR